MESQGPLPSPSLGEALSRLHADDPGVIRRTLDAGEFLFCQEDSSHAIYYILDGHVRIYLLAADGRERTLRILGPGELAGDCEFYLRRPHNAFAQAFNGPVTLFQVTRPAHEALLRRQPALYEALLRNLARTTTILTEAIERQTFQDLRERVQAALLGAAGRYGQPGPEGVRIQMHLTHETIASIVGATRTRVSVCLSELQRQGFYHIADGRIVLSPWAAGLVLPP